MRGQQTTRPWPTAEDVAAAQENGFDRKWSCFDLSDCRHTVNSLTELGSWQVEVCDDCGYVRVACTHTTCEWNPEGTLLRCTTCGIDAT